MIELTPHLTFFGKCKEALQFYIECMDGKLLSCLTFEEAQLNIGVDYKEKILSALFEAQGVFFYASDGFPDQPFIADSNVALKIESPDVNELEEIFKKLSHNAKILVPFDHHSAFGILIDKYNIRWILQSYS